MTDFLYGAKLHHMNHEEWLDRLIEPNSRRTAATKAGTSHSTISRQLAKGKLDPELVIALARAYDQSPADALVELGYLTAEELDLAGVPAALGYATNAQILDEIRQRTDPDAVRLLRGGGDPDVITPSFGRLRMSDMPDRFAASDRGIDAKYPDDSDRGEESQDPGNDDPA